MLEVKKPHGNLHQQVDSDYIKLMKEMQYILNKLIDANVKNPAAFGILVDGILFLLITHIKRLIFIT